jgi:hypothetical protein
MNKPGFVPVFILLVITAFAVLVTTIFYIKEKVRLNQRPSITTNHLSDIKKKEVSIPKLFPEVEWKENNNVSDINTIYISNNREQKRKQLKGDAWISSGKYSKEEILSLIENFQNYYTMNLPQRVWKQNYNYFGSDISPIFADGPIGSTWGYLKVEDNYLRMIALSYDDKSSLEPNCPCTLTLEVFVSEKTDLNKLLE